MLHDRNVEEELPRRRRERDAAPSYFVDSCGVTVVVVVVVVVSLSYPTSVNPFRTAVSFWGQFGTNYLEFDWCVPKTGLEF